MCISSAEGGFSFVLFGVETKAGPSTSLGMTRRCRGRGASGGEVHRSFVGSRSQANDSTFSG